MMYIFFDVLGVYLCQFSDLLQSGPHEPGFTGEMIIFKAIKVATQKCTEQVL